MDKTNEKNWNFRISDVEEELRKTREELEKKKKDEEVRSKNSSNKNKSACKLNTLYKYDLIDIWAFFGCKLI